MNGSSVVSSDLWTAEQAARYDEDTAHLATDQVLGPMLDLLVELADGGAALEFAIGTGRVAVPLHERGVDVAGIELSGPMVEQLRTKVDDAAIPVVVGDMATARCSGTFSLVYLVFNTIGNLCTQAEQVACFHNAARHLRHGGAFLVEVGVPARRRLPPGADSMPFALADDHVGLDTYDPVDQRGASHHFTRLDGGSYRRDVHHFRHVWPSELDLMAELAGMRLEHRWEDWDGRPFTGESERHVSVWRRVPDV